MDQELFRDDGLKAGNIHNLDDRIAESFQHPKVKEALDAAVMESAARMFVRMLELVSKSSSKEQSTNHIHGIVPNTST